MNVTFGFVLVLLTTALNGALVLVLARNVVRYGRQMPWVAVLTAYFALREVNDVRFVAHMLGGAQAAHHAPPAPGAWDIALGLASLVVLAVLALSSSRMLAGLKAMRDAAAYRAEEYERALRHYNQLVRHRVFNPLTVIRGSATTLRAGVGDGHTRDELLRVIVESADVIRDTTLEPERRGEEERSLDAVPRLPQPERRAAQATRAPHAVPGPLIVDRMLARVSGAS